MVLFFFLGQQNTYCKNMLDIGEAELGTLLLLMPIGQISTMILVGKLTSRYGSSRIIKNCFMLYPFILLLIGFVDSYWQLMIILFFFGVSGNLCNIAMNTQAIEVEKLTGRILMASYHGAWCFAGLVGALMGLLMVNIGLSTFYHFTLVFVIVGGLWWYCKDIYQIFRRQLANLNNLFISKLIRRLSD